MATAKKLPSGSYRVNLYIGKTAEGKRQYKSFTADTKKAAEYLAAQYNQKRVDINRSELLLSDAIERYIKSKENILSPSTIRGYYAVTRSYPPDLTKLMIKDITPEHIQTFLNSYAVTHSPKSCRNAHGLLSAVLKIHRPEMILNTTLPQKQKNNIYVPDESEVRAIYALVKGGNLEIPFLLATQCGLRASEIAALERKHIKDGYLLVEQAAVLGADNEEHIKMPKSYAGYRNVPITKDLQQLLLSKCSENGRLCSQKGINICNNWVKFRHKNNLNPQLNFHALRHHFASKCLLLGIPQKYIAEMMGHNSLNMIEKVYQHTFPSAMETYAELVRRSTLEVMQHEMQHKKI